METALAGRVTGPFQEGVAHTGAAAAHSLEEENQNQAEAAHSLEEENQTQAKVHFREKEIQIQQEAEPRAMENRNHH